MNFSFTLSGGFAGLKRHLSGDVSTLPTTIRQMMEQLAGSRNPPPEKNANPQARDTFHYTLTIENGGSKTFEYDETQVPPGLEELFEYLRTHAS